MTYEVGQFIDLSYLNKKAEVAASIPKSEARQEPAETTAPSLSSLYEVGASYIWDKATGQLTRRIPVAFA
jgi:hypothetical protein